MDGIYGSYNANATAKINLGEYFTQYKELIQTVENDFETGFDEKHLKEFSHSCSIEHLIIEDYSKPPMYRSGGKKSPPEIRTDVNLETLKKLKEKYANEPKMYRPALKYRNESNVNYSQPIEADLEAIPGEDILVYIRIYHPFSHHSYELTKRRLPIMLNHVLVILGQQTLAELRDKIDCISDLSCTIESSENPTEFIDENNKEKYKSSFFYIENTFYNDMRYEGCKDNSEPIINWAKTRKLGPFKTENMEDIRIDSLCVKFGYPWVFQHQGNCEHLITFSDARLVDQSDHLAIENYPRVCRVRPMKHPYCLMCIEKPVHWVVVGSDRIPHDPCHFCHECFLRYNYIDGKKIGTFKAYRYPRDVDILKWVNSEKEELQLTV